MKQKFIDINVFNSETKEIIYGLCIKEANGQQLNAVLALAPVGSVIEIRVDERELNTAPVK